MSQEAWTLILVLGGIVAVATLAGAVVLVIRVLRTRKLLGELGAGGKVAFYGALAYTVLPVDLLPDPIYLDDIGVLTGALLYLTRLVQKRRTARAGSVTSAPVGDVRQLPSGRPDGAATRH
ncbi:YkvA family protein [Micromonospora sp. WMMD1102]|uniref:YkvA family protein n=1 Tax=Micromonospora sp. WMMD1102 TaxID=3016105 RepID=UPI0024151853|nr:YkvA family protein [Micromonospora sp. WMMD1102]MDG4787057.1 YkvA family protein [Micromonospora sp. WMMD1102]